MADVFSKEKRSEIMSKIRYKNTKPELRLRKHLWNRGHRYKIHAKLPGKPDIIFPSKKLVVFVDGCFWHKCPLCFKKPASNVEYWESKIAYNLEKDERINKELAETGWNIIRLWEHEVNKNIDACLGKIEKSLLSVL